MDFLARKKKIELKNAIKSSNIVIICGPTGCGKSYAVRNLAGELNLEIQSLDKNLSNIQLLNRNSLAKIDFCNKCDLKIFLSKLRRVKNTLILETTETVYMKEILGISNNLNSFVYDSPVQSVKVKNHQKETTKNSHLINQSKFVPEIEKSPPNPILLNSIYSSRNSSSLDKIQTLENAVEAPENQTYLFNGPKKSCLSANYNDSPVLQDNKNHTGSRLYQKSPLFKPCCRNINYHSDKTNKTEIQNAGTEWNSNFSNLEDSFNHQVVKICTSSHLSTCYPSPLSSYICCKKTPNKLNIVPKSNLSFNKSLKNETLRDNRQSIASKIRKTIIDSDFSEKSTFETTFKHKSDYQVPKSTKVNKSICVNANKPQNTTSLINDSKKLRKAAISDSEEILDRRIKPTRLRKTIIESSLIEEDEDETIAKKNETFTTFRNFFGKPKQRMNHLQKLRSVQDRSLLKNNLKSGHSTFIGNADYWESKNRNHPLQNALDKKQAIKNEKVDFDFSFSNTNNFVSGVEQKNQLDRCSTLIKGQNFQNNLITLNEVLEPYAQNRYPKKEETTVPLVSRSGTQDFVDTRLPKRRYMISDSESEEYSASNFFESYDKTTNKPDEQIIGFNILELKNFNPRTDKITKNSLKTVKKADTLEHWCITLPDTCSGSIQKNRNRKKTRRKLIQAISEYQYKNFPSPSHRFSRNKISTGSWFHFPIRTHVWSQFVLFKAFISISWSSENLYIYKMKNFHRNFSLKTHYLRLVKKIMKIILDGLTKSSTHSKNLLKFSSILLDSFIFFRFISQPFSKHRNFVIRFNNMTVLCENGSLEFAETRGNMSLFTYNLTSVYEIDDCLSEIIKGAFELIKKIILNTFNAAYTLPFLKFIEDMKRYCEILRITCLKKGCCFYKTYIKLFLKGDESINLKAFIELFCLYLVFSIEQNSMFLNPYRFANNIVGWIKRKSETTKLEIPTLQSSEQEYMSRCFHSFIYEENKSLMIIVLSKHIQSLVYNYSNLFLGNQDRIFGSYRMNNTQNQLITGFINLLNGFDRIYSVPTLNNRFSIRKTAFIANKIFRNLFAKFSNSKIDTKRHKKAFKFIHKTVFKLKNSHYENSISQDDFLDTSDFGVFPKPKNSENPQAGFTIKRGLQHIEWKINSRKKSFEKKLNTSIQNVFESSNKNKGFSQNRNFKFNSTQGSLKYLRDVTDEIFEESSGKEEVFSNIHSPFLKDSQLQPSKYHSEIQVSDIHDLRMNSDQSEFSCSFQSDQIDSDDIRDMFPNIMVSNRPKPNDDESIKSNNIKKNAVFNLLGKITFGPLHNPKNIVDIEKSDCNNKSSALITTTSFLQQSQDCSTIHESKNTTPVSLTNEKGIVSLVKVRKCQTNMSSNPNILEDCKIINKKFNLNRFSTDFCGGKQEKVALCECDQEIQNLNFGFLCSKCSIVTIENKPSIKTDIGSLDQSTFSSDDLIYIRKTPGKPRKKICHADSEVLENLKNYNQNMHNVNAVLDYSKDEFDRICSDIDSDININLFGFKARNTRAKKCNSKKNELKRDCIKKKPHGANEYDSNEILTNRKFSDLESNDKKMKTQAIVEMESKIKPKKNICKFSIVRFNHVTAKKLQIDSKNSLEVKNLHQLFIYKQFKELSTYSSFDLDFYHILGKIFYNSVNLKHNLQNKEEFTISGYADNKEYLDSNRFSCLKYLSDPNINYKRIRTYGAANRTPGDSNNNLFSNKSYDNFFQNKMKSKPKVISDEFRQERESIKSELGEHNRFFKTGIIDLKVLEPSENQNNARKNSESSFYEQKICSNDKLVTAFEKLESIKNSFKKYGGYKLHDYVLENFVCFVTFEEYVDKLQIFAEIDICRKNDDWYSFVPIFEIFTAKKNSTQKFYSFKSPSFWEAKNNFKNNNNPEKILDFV